MFTRVLITVICLAGVAAAAWYFVAGQSADSQVSRLAAAPVVVAVEQARREQWQPTLRATGSLRAFQGVDVTSQESGMVTAIHFKSGSTVKRGELLVQQYVEDEVVRLEGLQAELALARKSYDRSQSLIGSKAVSQSQLDASLSELERMQSLVDNLEASIAKRSIRAPFDGVLGIRQIDVGEYIEPGHHIVSLEALDPMYVEFPVPQGRLQDVHTGQTVQVDTDAWPGEVFSGTVNAVEPRIDTATRSFRVQATIANPESRLKSGMFVNARVVLPLREAVLTIPQAAITYNPYGHSVFVIDSDGGDGGVAHTRYITLGETRGDQVEITSGLEPGEVVVTAGQLRLRDGSGVTIDRQIVIGNDPAPEPAES